VEGQHRPFFDQMKEYDILEDYEVLNAWKDVISLPVGKASKIELDGLKTLTAFEVSFEGTAGDRTIFDTQYNRFVRFSREMILLSPFPIYFYQSDFKPELISRLRTYKGIFSKKTLPDIDCCEVEIAINNKMSIIAGLAKVDSSNFNFYSNTGIDSAHSFIIATEESGFFTKNTVSTIVQEFTSHHGMSEINYLKLILRYCPQGAIIYRFGGDGGDRYFSLQIFCSKLNRKLITAMYQKINLLDL